MMINKLLYLLFNYIICIFKELLIGLFILPKIFNVKIKRSIEKNFNKILMYFY